jgi:YbbR domain-containing protein
MNLLGRLLFHNFIYKVIAVLVAAVLWAAVQGSSTVEESLDLPIVLENRPDDLVVVGQSAVEVNLRLVGSRAALRAARRDLSTYPISLEGLSPGEARFPVNNEALQLPTGASVAARAPSTVVLQTEPVVRKKVPVRADVVGTPAPGYKVLAIEVKPAQVTLAGARSSIRRLREVMTERIDLNDIQESFERPIPLAFGGSLVWRAEEDSEPVVIHIEIEAPEKPGELQEPEIDEESAAGRARSSQG